MTKTQNNDDDDEDDENPLPQETHAGMIFQDIEKCANDEIGNPDPENTVMEITDKVNP